MTTLDEFTRSDEAGDDPNHTPCDLCGAGTPTPFADDPQRQITFKHGPEDGPDWFDAQLCGACFWGLARDVKIRQIYREGQRSGGDRE